MTQLVTRIDEGLASDLDRLVAMGVVDSRSDAVRQGLRSLIDAHERRSTADAIIRGYSNTPQSQGEFVWSDEATRRMITEEPW
jgi:Arc/MetJ-type ribon-helix-helix transcriptional regulator